MAGAVVLGVVRPRSEALMLGYLGGGRDWREGEEWRWHFEGLHLCKLKKEAGAERGVFGVAAAKTHRKECGRLIGELAGMCTL